jgi:hypothetical protein
MRYRFGRILAFHETEAALDVTLAGMILQFTLLSSKIWYATVALAIIIRLVVALFTGHTYDLGIWMNTWKYVALGKSPYDFHKYRSPPLWALLCALSFMTSNFIAPGNQSAYIFVKK